MYESVGNPELDSWTIEALPVTPSLLDLAIPRMVLYMLYLYNCVCVYKSSYYKYLIHQLCMVLLMVYAGDKTF